MKAKRWSVRLQHGRVWAGLTATPGSGKPGCARQAAIPRTKPSSDLIIWRAHGPRPASEPSRGWSNRRGAGCRVSPLVIFPEALGAFCVHCCPLASARACEPCGAPRAVRATWVLRSQPVLTQLTSDRWTGALCFWDGLFWENQEDIKMFHF